MVSGWSPAYGDTAATVCSRGLDTLNSIVENLPKITEDRLGIKVQKCRFPWWNQGGCLPHSSPAGVHWLRGCVSYHQTGRAWWGLEWIGLNFPPRIRLVASWKVKALAGPAPKRNTCLVWAGKPQSHCRRGSAGICSCFKSRRLDRCRLAASLLRWAIWYPILALDYWDIPDTV